MEEGPYCSKGCFDKNDLNNRSTDQITEVIMNLVTLAIKANDVVIKGSFSGANADEVNALLKMCNEVHKQYVEEVK